MFKKGDIVELKVDGHSFSLGGVGTGVGIVVGIYPVPASRPEDSMVYEIRKSDYLYPDKWYIKYLTHIDKFPRNLRLYHGE
jgi:hypothetical protein